VACSFSSRDGFTINLVTVGLPKATAVGRPAVAVGCEPKCTVFPFNFLLGFQIDFKSKSFRFESVQFGSNLGFELFRFQALNSNRKSELGL
jgi:hypothetical protein